MTCLNMAGFSVSLVLLNGHSKVKTPIEVDALVSLFDAPTDTPGWKWNIQSVPNQSVLNQPQLMDNLAKIEVPKLTSKALARKSSKEARVASKFSSTALQPELFETMLKSLL